MRLVRAFLAAALVALAPAGAAGVHARAPAGVHLSLGARDDEMIVTWATFAPLASPTVRFGPLEDGAEDDAAARDARVGTRAQAATTRAFNDGGEDRYLGPDGPSWKQKQVPPQQVYRP